MFTAVFESAKTPSEKQERVKLIKEGVALHKATKGAKGLDPLKFNTQDIGEACFTPKERKAIRESGDRTISELCARENVAPVNQSTFSDITLLLVNAGVVMAYESPEFIGGDLCTEINDIRDNAQMAGVQPIPETASNVAEGEEYPTVRIKQDSIQTPTSIKRGLKIGVTKEALIFDQTGQILEACQAVGEYVAKAKDMLIMRTVLGVDNTFKRLGVARNTYVATADPRINLLASTPMVDWHSFDAAWQVFNAMRDDKNVPEPIAVNPKIVLVPQNLLMTAAHIVDASQTREASNGGNTQAYGANPLSRMLPTLKTSQWIEFLYQLNGIPDGTWYWGDFKAAFGYRTVIPLSVIAAPANAPAEFDRDVVAQFRASERGVPYVKAPWKVLKVTA